MASSNSTIGERFTQVRRPAVRAFPELQVFEGEAPSIADAMRDQHLNFELTTKPAFIRFDDGSELELPERQVVREAHNGFGRRVFGPCGPRWKPIQTDALADLLQPFADRYTLDSLGARDDGTDIIASFKVETVEINGERVDEYFLCRFQNKYGKALRFYWLPIRFRCMNQLVTGLRSSQLTVPIVHVGDIEGGVQLNLDVFRTLDIVRQTTHRAFRQMGAHTLSDEEIARVVSAAHPYPILGKKARTLYSVLEAEKIATEQGIDLEPMAEGSREQLDEAWRFYEYFKGRADQLREDTREVLERFNDEHPNLANTGWAVYNAVAELADYRNATSDEGLAENLLFGQRAKEKARAFDVVLEIVDPTFNDVPDYEPESRRRRSPGTGTPKVKAPRLTTEQRQAREQERLDAMSEEERTAYLERRNEREARQAARIARQTERDPEQEAAEAMQKAQLAQARAERAKARAELISRRAVEARARLARQREDDETPGAEAGETPGPEAGETPGPEVGSSELNGGANGELDLATALAEQQEGPARKHKRS